MFDFLVKRIGRSCLRCGRTRCSDCMLEKWGPELKDLVGGSTNLAEACANYEYDRKRAAMRFVFGTTEEKWHLVGGDDRDYAHGITQEEMAVIGPVLARDKYLNPRGLT